MPSKTNKIIKKRSRHTRKKQKGGDYLFEIDFTRGNSILIIYENNDCSLIEINQAFIKEYLFSLPYDLYDTNLQHVYIDYLHLSVRTDKKSETIYEFRNTDKIVELLNKYWIFSMVGGYKDKIKLPLFGNRIIKTCITCCNYSKIDFKINSIGTSYNLDALMNFGIKICEVSRLNYITDVSVIFPRRNFFIDSMSLSWNGRPYKSNNHALDQNNHKNSNNNNKDPFEKLLSNNNKPGLALQNNERNTLVNDSIPLDKSKQEQQFYSDEKNKSVYFIKNYIENNKQHGLIIMHENPTSRSVVNTITIKDVKSIKYICKTSQEINIILEGPDDKVFNITYKNKPHMTPILVYHLSWICDIQTDTVKIKNVYKNIIEVRKSSLFVLNNNDESLSNISYTFTNKTVKKINDVIVGLGGNKTINIDYGNINYENALVYNNGVGLDTSIPNDNYRILYKDGSDQNLSQLDAIKQLFENLKPQASKIKNKMLIAYSFPENKKKYFSIDRNESKLLMFCVELITESNTRNPEGIPYNFGYKNKKSSIYGPVVVQFRTLSGVKQLSVGDDTVDISLIHGIKFDINYEENEWNIYVNMEYKESCNDKKIKTMMLKQKITFDVLPSARGDDNHSRNNHSRNNRSSIVSNVPSNNASNGSHADGYKDFIVANANVNVNASNGDSITGELNGPTIGSMSNINIFNLGLFVKHLIDIDAKII
uniref:Uncharacterized protein n=1 Tax=viral metagenome TaxID=1070528 RepID=A0A6C0E822_9ZZZZ